MSIKFSGFDKLEKDLKKLQKSAEELEKTTEVPFSELFNKSFMKKYTSFNSFSEFLEAGKFNVTSQTDFENIPNDKFNQHISKTTKFSNWNEMLNEAGNQYVCEKLNFK